MIFFNSDSVELLDEIVNIALVAYATELKNTIGVVAAGCEQSKI